MIRPTSTTASSATSGSTPKQDAGPRLEARNPGAAANLWAHIDHKIVGQAPWVPLYNPRALVLVSPRVGNYQFDPFWTVLIDQLWVQ